MKSHKINITIDARLILNQMTGIGNYLTHLINALLEIDSFNRYKVLLNDLLNDSHPIKMMEYKNYFKKKVAIAPVHLGQQLLIPLKLMTDLIDVYHYPHFDLPFLQRFKSVVTIHDLIYNVLPGSFPELSAPKKAYMNFFHQVVAKKAKKIIVVSNSTKKDFIRLYKAPAEKIHVIPLAVNDEFRPAVNEDEIKKKLIQHGIRKKYFLFVGERRPHKNIVRMIEAFKRFRERSSKDYQFVIVGKNYSNYSAPEEKIKVLSLERDVILTDYVSDETLKLYYQGAEALVFASLYEGFGIPILEAMSCGVLVITSNVSSMPEVAGDAAILVDPKNSDQISREMERVVTNSELKNDLMVKGLRRARQFSWKKTAERTLSIYEEIYANGSGRN